MYADKPVVTFKNNDITPEPDSKEIQRVSDSLIADMDKYSPQGMLAMKALSYSKQAQEQPKPLYVNAWLFEDVAPKNWVPQIKKLGINGVEVKATTLYRPEFKDVWSLLKKEGMTVGAVHAGPDLVPFNFGVISSDDPDFIDPLLAWLEKTMEIMADAGIPRLVLYPGYRTRVIYIDQKISHAGSHTPKSLKRLCKKAKELGLEIIIESAPYQLYQKPEDLVKLAKDINSPVLKLGFDTGATAMIHNGNDIESNLDKTLKFLSESELLDYVHLSDLRHHPNGTLIHNHKPLGEGIIPENAYKKMLSICHDINKPVSLYLLVSKEEPLKALEKSLRMIGEL